MLTPMDTYSMDVISLPIDRNSDIPGVQHLQPPPLWIHASIAHTQFRLNTLEWARLCASVLTQARRKQLQIGGGGAHIIYFFFGGGGGTHRFFLFFFIFFFFWGGAYLCKLLGGGARRAPPPPRLFLRSCNYM